MSPHRWFAALSTAGTCCRIEISSLAVFGWMTLFDGDGLAWTYWPAALYVPAISVGWTRTPLLAIVAYTLAICTALTETPWPYDRVYRSSPAHCDGGGRALDRYVALGSSPGRPRPVGWPSPNAFR